LAQVDVSDAEAYKAYAAAIQDVLRTFGGRYVVRAGRSETMEGKTRSRLVTIEFKDYETALGCYRSPDYGKVEKLRQLCAHADAVVDEGYSGLQPWPATVQQWRGIVRSAPPVHARFAILPHPAISASDREECMSDLRLIVAGAGGRMGRTLIEVISDTEGAGLVGAVEAPGSAVIGRDAGELVGLGANGILVTPRIEPLTPKPMASSTSPFPRRP
jgi:uncharacterized protein (DUF1330 family)